MYKIGKEEVSGNRIRFTLQPLDGENGDPDYHLWRLIEGRVSTEHNMVSFSGLATSVNLYLTINDPAGNLVNQIFDFAAHRKGHRVSEVFVTDSIRSLLNKYWTNRT